ncbi:MAG: hypothetical protein IPG92_14790 [Flavobacteriales bacterium]|nr:hypothetical protein [Flavobacteriales bacterium]
MEFTATPICTASRQYQDLKIEQLKGMGLSDEAYARSLERIRRTACAKDSVRVPC